MSNVRTIDQGDLEFVMLVPLLSAAVSTEALDIVLVRRRRRFAYIRKMSTGTDNALEGSFICRAINSPIKRLLPKQRPFYEALKRDNGGGKEFFDAANTYYNAFIQNLKTTTPTVWKNLLKIVMPAIESALLKSFVSAFVL